MQNTLSLFLLITLICCFSCTSNSQNQKTESTQNQNLNVDTTTQFQQVDDQNSDLIPTQNKITKRDTHGLLKQTLKMDWFVESDTAFDHYYCDINDSFFEVFLQYLKDSGIKGYYKYKYVNKVPITGKKFQDSIIIYSPDKASQNNPIGKLVVKNDSAYGNWYYSKEKIKLKVKLIKSNWYTGDIENYNYQNNALVFKENNQNYRIPISKYFDNRYNYAFDPLLTEFKDGYFYTLVRFYRESLNKNEKGRFGWRASYQYLMFAKFNTKGEIVKNQVFKINSDNENIENESTYGLISGVMKDSLNLDVFYLNEDYKYNVSIDRKNIDKGLLIKKVKTNIAKYVYDTLTLNLDKQYHLVLKFKLRQLLGEFDQRYSFDSVIERDKKDIRHLSAFCKDLNRYEVVYIDNKIERPFSGDEFKTGDYNFDGFKDIFIKDSDGSGAHNQVIRIWTYNNKTKKYEINKFLSSLPIYGLDEKTKSLHAYWHHNAMEGRTAIYRKINGKIKLFESEETRINKKNSTLITTTGKLIKNKWVETKTVSKLE